MSNISSNLKKGDRVWIKEGTGFHRFKLPKGPVFVEVVDLLYPDFIGKCVSGNPEQNEDTYIYRKDEIFHPKLRRATFIGGYQKIQKSEIDI